MSCLNLDIHKLKEVVVGHMNPKWDSYYSMVLALMKGWHVEPFACGLETQLGDFDTWPNASTTNFLQQK